MRTFQFKLEALLKFRDQKIQILTHELSKLDQDWVSLVLEEKKVLEEYMKTQEEMRKNRGENQLREETQYHHYLNDLQMTLIKLHKEKTIKERQSLIQKQALQKALQERKLVEELKKRRYHDWLLEKHHEHSF